MSKKSGATQSRPQAKQQYKSPYTSQPSRNIKGPNGTNGAIGTNGTNGTNGAKAVATAPKPAVDPAQARANEEARRQARFERQAANKAAADKRKRMLMLRNIGIGGGVAVVLIAVLAFYMISEANKPGQGFPMEPSPHIQTVNDPHAPYSTDPPTSGPHVPTLPQWGVHTDVLPLPLQVHALEDAGVVVNYQPNIDKATLDRLTALVSGYDTQVILSPYPNLSNPIVLTAWTRMDKLDKFDEARIQKFIQAYKGIDHHRDSGS